MGTSLTGLTPSTTYDALIKVGDNGALSATAKVLSDGLGNDSPLAMSTTLVGIGTATPTLGKLSVKDSGFQYIAEPADTATFGYLGVGHFSNGAYIGTNAGTNTISDILRLGTTGAERMRITSAGDVGIGTTSPNSKLNVIGEISQNDFSTTNISTFSQRSSNSIFTIITDGTSAAQGTSINYSWANGGQGPLIFSRAAGEVMRLSSDGYVRLSSGSGGIQFNGDTSASNALDDYEEGTFTPTIIGSSTAGTATYTTQVGRYTKIGRQVSCQIDIGYNSGTGTGDLAISGLPFAENQATNPAVTIGYFDAITLTALNYAMAYIASGSARIDFVQIPVGGGALTSVAYDGSGRIILNVTYVA
jgi:hypothetical protein